MSQFNFVRRCHNCGAILQSDNPNEPGYVAPEYLGDLSSRVVFCDHCYEDSRYNFAPSSPSVDNDITTMLQDAEAADALIVLVVDLFSFENSFIPEVIDIIQGLPLVVVANKRDLMPKHQNDEDLKEYVAHRCRVAKLSCTHDDVVLCSLTSESDVSGIWEIINAKRRAHDVYVIGARFAGKTQLISCLLRSYVNPTGQSVTRVTYPGTQISVMQIPLDVSSYLYDSPGTSLSNSNVSRVNKAGFNRLVPSKEVEAKKVVMEKGDTFFIGGLAYVQMVEGEKTVFDFYASNKVETGKCSKPEAEAIFFKKFNKQALLPVPEGKFSNSDYDAYDIIVTENTRRDIGIAGLGWFNFQGANQTLRVYVLKGVGVYASRPKVAPYVK